MEMTMVDWERGGREVGGTTDTVDSGSGATDALRGRTGYERTLFLSRTEKSKFLKLLIFHHVGS